jgi:hypothetical protein
MSSPGYRIIGLWGHKAQGISPDLLQVVYLILRIRLSS